MEIRRAAKKDIKRISEIIKTEYGKPPYNDKWTDRTALKTVKEYFRHKSIFVAEIEKEIAGFIIGYVYSYESGPMGYVNEFIVSSEFQKRGVGKKLMKHIENYFKKKKVKKIALHASIKSKAYEIYKNWGYKKSHFIMMEKKIK
ncbi:GNAT family N-acetyltransferase [Candidatus Woesearchaeota archaeon]|nr:GNAT family N-acetyltransferase [Candidatus Woesearchaeota archaeon]